MNRIMTSGRHIAAAAVFFGMLSILSIAYAATYEVGSGQTYVTIQACLNVVKPGDTCNVHAGTYTEQLTLPTSGTFANRITLRQNGIDVVTVQNSTSPVINLNGKSYWTFNGLNVTYTGSEGALRVIQNTNGANIDYLTITNCYVKVLGGSGIAVQIFSSDQTIFSNNTVEIAAYNTAGAYVNGLDMGLATSNARISGNHVFGAASETLGHGNDLISVDGTNILIENNLVHDGWSFDSHPDCIIIQAYAGDRFGNPTGNITIRNNTIYNCTSGIYAYNINSSIVGTNLIYNNVIYETSDFRYGGIAGVMACLQADGAYTTLPVPPPTLSVAFYNNTVDCAQMQLHILRLRPGSSVTVKNNVFVRALLGFITIDKPEGVTIDYNYYNALVPSTPVIRESGSWYTLSSFQSGGLGESHSVSGTANLGEKYVATASSGIHNLGVNLSSLFTTDMLGTPRLAVGAWDMGAYVQQSDLKAPSAPVNLQVN